MLALIPVSVSGCVKLDLLSVMKRHYWIWPFVWSAVIFLTSCTVVTSRQLAHAVNTASAGKVTTGSFLHFWSYAWWLAIKGWHTFEFGLLFTLLTLATKKPLLAIALSALFAASDEYHQTFVPSRGGHFSDWLIDMLGIAGAALLWWIRTTGWLAKPLDHRRTAALVVGTFAWLLALAALSFHPF